MAENKKNGSGDTRAAILDAAEKIFIKKGFADTAVSEIAKKAKITKSLIHHHFGSKEQLWQEVKQHRFAEYAEIQKGILSHEEISVEKLVQSLEEYFRFLMRNQKFSRLISWIYLEDEGQTSFEVGEDLIRLEVGKIREAQEAGIIRTDLDPFHIMMFSIGLVHHWFMAKDYHVNLMNDFKDKSSDEEYLKDMLKIMLEGLAPRIKNGE